MKIFSFLHFSFSFFHDLTPLKMSKKFIYFLTIILVGFLNNQSFASSSSEDYNKFAIKVGSFVYHIEGDKDSSKYTEEFDNKLLAASYKFSQDKEIVIGSLLNSYSDRCAIIGMGKNWHQINSKLSFEGLYAYAGEFFFDNTQDCGNKGIYQTIKQKTGLGFAPYIYHGIKYKLLPNFALELGLIAPTVLVATTRFEF